VTLLGLAAKNAILIVEFALLKSQEGLSVLGGLGGGRAAALPADPHDLARVHPRRVAPRVLVGRGRRRAPLGRHGRHGRHARGDFLAIFFVPFFFKLIMSRKLGEPRSSEELKREASHHREMATRPVHHETHRGTPRTEGSHD
jgi:HAE1 family hydrophobic/amphiphilic exporter-1/multidrug efflux pump